MNENIQRLTDALEREEMEFRVAAKRLERANKALSEGMRNARLSADVSLRGLATAMNISAAYLSDMELGNRRYSKEHRGVALLILEASKPTA